MTGAASGSVAARADTAAVAGLAARGLRYRGLRLTPRAVRLVNATSARATVDVVVDVSRYDVVDPAGRVRRHVPADPGQRTRMDVVRTATGWRVADVHAAAS